MTEYARNLSKAFGYLHLQEVDALQKRIAPLLPKKAVIANVGSGVGTSSLAIKEVRPDVLIYTIDKSRGGPLGGLENERNAFAGTGLELSIQILGDSVDIGMTWSKGKLDAVIIDADHSYPNVLADIGAWEGHVKPGGLLIFHDYDAAHWPGVKKAVDEHFGEQKPVMHVDTLIAFERIVAAPVVKTPSRKGRAKK